MLVGLLFYLTIQLSCWNALTHRRVASLSWACNSVYSDVPRLVRQRKKTLKSRLAHAVMACIQCVVCVLNGYCVA